MNFFANAIIATYITSTFFMLCLYINTKTAFAREGMKFSMPLSVFLWVHFMPIVHTVKLIKIWLRAMQLEKERKLS